ncbi:hypothetical protein E8E14_009987 [Neopestalotiopsis sp. 37M]|nr:hypothetical protein E8E14_009987 [Neopestalotiopsis sp. 37M]
MSALAIVGTHTLEVQGSSKLTAVTTLYFLWFVLFIAFASLCLDDHRTKDSIVVMVCTYYLIWVIAVLYSLGIAQAGNGDTLFIWTPICVQIGIIPGASIQKCVSKVWTKSKFMVLFVLEKTEAQNS